MTNYKEILSKYTYQGDTKIIERIRNSSAFEEREAKDIINAIVLWKVNRQVDIDFDLFCRIRQLNLNDISDVQNREKEIREIINLLLGIKGVRIAMASTILKMFYPNVLPIIDQRAYRELYEGKELPRYMKIQDYINTYINYVYECHAYYTKNCGEQIDFQDLDKVLYQMDIDKGNKIYY